MRKHNQSSENPYYETIKVSLPVLIEIMRYKVCPRPNIGEENWIRVVECMEETIRFAEEWFANCDFDELAFMKSKATRERRGEEMTSIVTNTEHPRKP